MGKIAAYARLMRVEHSLMLVVAVVAAELLSGGLPTPTILLLSIITPIFISMGSFAINDYFDMSVDKANKRNRPLVTGTIKPMYAVYATAISLLIGALSSAFINLYAFAIALAFALLSVLYAYWLKEKLFWGNAYVAFAMVIPFIYGNYVVSYRLGFDIVLISIMIFFAGFAREVQGTIRDLAGDVKVRNAHTIPKAIGVAGAAWLALSAYAVAILISAGLATFVAPFRLNLIFIIPIIVTDAMLLRVGIGYIINREEMFYSRARNTSLAAMAIALLAILASTAFTISL
ncbi:MAG: UbiA family prenyltransferase [Candidatus Micrarchaeaceae archaeon]